MVKHAVLDDEIHKQIKIVSAKKGTSIQDLINEIIKKELNKIGKEQINQLIELNKEIEQIKEASKVNERKKEKREKN